MSRRRSLALIAVLAGALAVPAGASAADCGLQAPRAGVDHPIAGTRLVARDPYGGLLPRNRLFFDFSVRGADTALAKVAKVQWSLDGTVVREDPRAPFEWKGLSGSSRRMPAGDHTITVTVTPTSGDPASTSFPLTATDCQNASFDARVPRSSGPSAFSWSSAFEARDGAPLASVSATATRNVAVALPVRLRGRAIGTLAVGRKTYTLKGSSTALARGTLRVRFTPGAKRFLTVSGLPAGTTAVSVKLRAGVIHVRSRRARFAVTGGLAAVSGARVQIASGGRYV